MPFELGGRGDKQGNQYEKQWVAQQIIRVIKEELTAIQVEALGDDEIGADVVAYYTDGTIGYHQCKGRNGTADCWRMGDLQANRIFEYSKHHLERDVACSYYFISPFTCNMLSDLCCRARNSGSAEDFVAYQMVEVDKMKQTFLKYMYYMDLNGEELYDLQKGFSFMQRTFFVQVPDDIERRAHLKEMIWMLFAGDSESILTLLEDFPTAQNYLGKNITGKIIIDFLSSHDYYLRPQQDNKRVQPQLYILNNEFKSCFRPVADHIFNRAVAEDIIQKLAQGESFVIHGKAGAGKSGCVQQAIEWLEENHTTYLAIKLDKRVPTGTTQLFGESMGLPASPIVCLHAISPDSPCVLILDQLDSLRWTATHSATVLEVCKSLIREAEICNIDRKAKISIVFVCRTYDYENDAGIKALTQNSGATNRIKWSDHRIDVLTATEVEEILGESYTGLSTKTKNILQLPSSLYVWCNLSELKKANPIATANQLFSEWWGQIKDNCIQYGLSELEVEGCKDNIADGMNVGEQLFVPKQLLRSSNKVLDALTSNGLVYGDASRVAFVHQSFYDYFLVEHYVAEIWNGKNICDVIGAYNEQTPNKRYRFQMLLQSILDSDETLFLKQCELIVQCDTIRYYYKCIVFELLGQIDDPSDTVVEFVSKYWDDANWKSIIYSRVFLGRPQFIKQCIALHFYGSWQDEPALTLLHSINTKDPDFVVAILQQLCFQDAELDKRLYGVLPFQIDNDTETLFDLRKAFFNRYPELLVDFDPFITPKKSPGQTIELLAIMLNHSVKGKRVLHYLGSLQDEDFAGLAEAYAEKILDSLFEPLCAAVGHCFDKYDVNEQWIENGKGRIIVDLIVKAFAHWSLLHADNTKERIAAYLVRPSPVVHELVLGAMFTLPVSESDYVIEWLLSDPQNNIFDTTSKKPSSLTYAQEIIGRFSSSCSQENFVRLETAITYYHDPEELRHAQWRFDGNKNPDKCYYYYHVYWGDVQKALLPFLDANRRSHKTNELIAVLNRNEWITSSSFDRIRSSGGFVRSPIDTKQESISDKTWIKIITSPKLKGLDRRSVWGKGINRKDGVVEEASCDTFAGAFFSASKTNPVRFAQTALQLPMDIDDHYISAIFHLLACPLTENNPCTYVDMATTTILVRRHMQTMSMNSTISFIRLLEDRADEKWPEDIIEWMLFLAVNHENPEPGKYNVTRNDDKEQLLIESLHSNAINCVRGTAAYVVAKFLWIDSGYAVQFKPIIDQLTRDAHPAVRFAALSCINAYYNFDKEQAITWFFEVAEQDIRVLGTQEAWDILIRAYETYPQKCEALIVQMYFSQGEDISKLGAIYLTAIYLFRGAMAEVLHSATTLNEAQKEGILEQALSVFDQDQFNTQCKELILRIIEMNPQKHNLQSLFFRRNVNLMRDRDFIITLIANPNLSELIYAFLHFIEGSEENLGEYIEFLKVLCRQICTNRNAPRWHLDSRSFTKCIIKLYADNSTNPAIVNDVLDMWDELYKANLVDSGMETLIDE